MPTPTPCHACPLRRLDLFVTIPDGEVDAIQDFKAGEMHVEAGTQILMEGTRNPQIYTVLRGMGLRYKTIEDGRRQVINFVFPGDFIGLQSTMMGEMKHSIEASTAMTLCVFERGEFWSFFRDHPERAFDITWLAAVQEHFLGEALTSVGQRNALERMAWAIAKIVLRAQALGLTAGNRCPLPYKQQDIADALGLSLVHTNKTLAKLRDRQLASWSNGAIQVHDMEGLVKLAKMDLHGPEPRPLI